tara:strand:+ start:3645 stop:3890 length:246 start_codon:yes stop_codon:yes gene_type:complete
MFKNFIIKNLTTVTILIFLVIFIILIINKPQFIFKKNGQPREFGIGYKNKTILPIWLAVIIIAIFSYLFVLYYINFNKFVF